MREDRKLRTTGNLPKRSLREGKVTDTRSVKQPPKLNSKNG